MFARTLVTPKTLCIIAPRGECSLGALSLKAARKNLFICLANAIRLYQGLFWQASSDFEKSDIRRMMGSIARRVFVAPDLTPVQINHRNSSNSRLPGPLRLVFCHVFLARKI